MKTLLMGLVLVLALAIGALTAGAADVRYTRYGPWAGSSTDAAATAFCTDPARGYDAGIVRNGDRVYGGGLSGQPGYWYLCYDLPDAN